MSQIKIPLQAFSELNGYISQNSRRRDDGRIKKSEAIEIELEDATIPETAMWPEE